MADDETDEQTQYGGTEGESVERDLDVEDQEDEDENENKNEPDEE